jgi:hypothetical protein
MAIHMRIHDICCLLNKPAGVVVVGCSDRLGLHVSAMTFAPNRAHERSRLPNSPR